MEKYSYGVLTVSDSRCNKSEANTSGRLIVEMIKSKFKSEAVTFERVPKDQAQIEAAIENLCDVLKVNVVFTTGGSSLSPRDVTPEATRLVITQTAQQLDNLLFLESATKCKTATLSRPVCGIRNKTLIINFPDNETTFEDYLEAINNVGLNSVQLICGQAAPNSLGNVDPIKAEALVGHVCPHVTGKGGDDRNSTFPMIDVQVALNEIFIRTKPKFKNEVSNYSPVNSPPFRASIKDGYAIKAGQTGSTKVVGNISAGDDIITQPFAANECYKINTGAPLPDHADAIVQIEDTRLLQSNDETELLVDILVAVPKGYDIREIGSDMKIGDALFEHNNPIGIAERSVLASVGVVPPSAEKIKVAILSTGAELTAPPNALKGGGIYDANTTMLKLLVEHFGCEVHISDVVDDDRTSLQNAIFRAKNACDVVICSGGVSMGDKDYVKPVITSLGYEVVFGRVNMKPGKPTTFGYDRKTGGSFFGLPGNPVSAFVTFHLFVLPHLKYLAGWTKDKCFLPTVTVKLLSANIPLDSRPEYCRATIISKNGQLWADITGNQISSRLVSIIGADCLVAMPARTSQLSSATAGMELSALILKHDFISKYE